MGINANAAKLAAKKVVDRFEFGSYEGGVPLKLRDILIEIFGGDGAAEASADVVIDTFTTQIGASVASRFR